MCGPISCDKIITTFVSHATEILIVFALYAKFVTYPARGRILLSHFIQYTVGFYQ